MPNYVHNILEITSKNDNAEDIINFIKKHFNEEGLFDFNTFVPEPASEKDCPPKYNYNTPLGQAMKDKDLSIINGEDWFNWYDWRIHYWGTKWNCGEESRCYYDFDKIREGYSDFSPLYVHFKTAWNAPFPIFKMCYTLHPELDFEITYHSTENDEYGVFYDMNDVVNYIEYDLVFMGEIEIPKENK